MSTLHLKYSSLKRILDGELSDGIVSFIKKQNITNILTCLPTDICMLINAYDYEEFNLRCECDYYDATDYYLSFTLQDMISFKLDVSYDKICIMLSDSKSLNTFDNSIKGYNRIIMNEFMKKYYNKDKYFELQKKYKGMRILYVKNIILIQDSGLYGIEILNYKYFKYTIVMINCLLKAISKYKKK